jgi:predicted RNA-binding protein with PIN domain
VTRYIIDGYNVMHAHPAYAALAREDFDAARARLVSDLAGFAQAGPRVVVVFDGGANPASDGVPHHVGALTVIFSPAGADADSVVEALAARSRQRGEQAIVVTSDAETRRTVRSGTVSTRSARAFVEELTAEAAERTVGARVTRRVPIDRRIGAEVREALSRWARGDAPQV